MKIDTSNMSKNEIIDLTLDLMDDVLDSAIEKSKKDQNFLEIVDKLRELKNIILLRANEFRDQ